MIKLLRPLIVFDLETTGPNPETDRIVSLGFQKFVDRFPEGLARTYKTLVRPLVPIPSAASFGTGGKYSGHGITDEMVNGCRVCGLSEGGTDAHQMLGDSPHAFAPWPTFAHIAPSLVKGFSGVDFGGFNIRFDLQTTRSELLRVGIEWDHGDAAIIDGFRLWQVAIPRSLSDAVEEFCGRKATDAHEAGADVADAVDVICGILRKFGSLPRDVGEIDRLCSPGRIDADGKFVFDETGVPIVNFGKKWKGAPLRDAARCTCSGRRCDCLRGYLQWMLQPKQTFAPSTKKIAADALKGIYPQQGLQL
jgi:DNA polymerase III epsilon subunit-like protein